MIKILLQFYKLRSRKKSNRYILAMLYNISLIPENIRCKRHYIIFFPQGKQIRCGQYSYLPKYTGH